MEQKHGPSKQKPLNVGRQVGFLNSRRVVPGSTPRQQKVHLLSPIIPSSPSPPTASQTDFGAEMSWSAAEDRRLLLFGLERKMEFKDHAAIAKVFPEQPTPKAIQERIAKLRREQNELLIASGILNAAASATVTTSKENKSGLLSTPTTKKLPHRSLSSMDKELLSKEFYTNEDLEELKQLFTGLIPDEVLEASHRELREKREKVLRESKEKTKAAKALLDLSTEESE